MKKIIAREGLIILSIALLASCLLLTITWFDDKASEIDSSKNRSIVSMLLDEPETEEERRIGQQADTYRGYSDTTSSIFFVVLFLYPLYLIMRFVIWAICTLRRT